MSVASEKNTRYLSSQRELYVFTVKNRDEITQWVQWDDAARKWMSTFTLRLPLQTHHVFGRGKNQEYNWFCNLIHCGAAAHGYCHDVKPSAFELASLRAKMAFEQERIEKKTAKPDCESKWMWHPEVMAKLIHRDSLAGRVNELMNRDGVEGTVFHRYGQELVSFLDK